MKVETYSRKPLFGRRQWYWRVRAANGRIVAVGGEGYNNRADLLSSMHRAGDAIVADARRMGREAASARLTGQ